MYKLSLYFYRTNCLKNGIQLLKMSLRYNVPGISQLKCLYFSRRTHQQDIYNNITVIWSHDMITRYDHSIWSQDMITRYAQTLNNTVLIVSVGISSNVKPTSGSPYLGATRSTPQRNALWTYLRGVTVPGQVIIVLLGPCMFRPYHYQDYTLLTTIN